jgi:hypothetical protein
VRLILLSFLVFRVSHGDLPQQGDSRRIGPLVGLLSLTPLQSFFLKIVFAGIQTHCQLPGVRQPRRYDQPTAGLSRFASSQAT